MQKYYIAILGSCLVLGMSISERAEACPILTVDLIKDLKSTPSGYNFWLNIDDEQQELRRGSKVLIEKADNKTEIGKAHEMVSETDEFTDCEYIFKYANGIQAKFRISKSNTRR